jgi:hypothetical protein
MTPAHKDTPPDALQSSTQQLTEQLQAPAGPEDATKNFEPLATADPNLPIRILSFLATALRLSSVRESIDNRSQGIIRQDALNLLDSVVNDEVFISKFVANYADLVRGGQKQQADLSQPGAQQAGARFERFLIQQGESPDTASAQRQKLEVFMSEELPELSVLSAVMELREQFHGHAGNKPSYPGKRSGITPADFVIEHYADNIRAGSIGPGQLAISDRRLYGALRDDLRAQDPPQSMANFFDSVRLENKRGKLSERRVRACAAVLGANDDQAARFFGTLRGAAFSGRSGSPEKGRP